MDARPEDIGSPTEEDLSRPANFLDKMHIAYRFGSVVAAAIPPTTIPPMAFTYLGYKRFENEKRFHKLHWMFDWANYCARQVLKMDIRMKGREKLQDDRSRLMFICNHQSYTDIPLIMGSMRIGAFLSKKLVAYIPFVGQVAYLGGTIYFSRKTPESRRKAMEETLRMCEESTPVVVFPEGTRSTNGQLREKVHLGSLQACWERNIRIGTFAFDGTRYANPPTMDRYFVDQRVAIVVGDTLDPGDFPNADEYATAAWAEVERRFVEARQMRLSSDWESYPRP